MEIKKSPKADLESTKKSGLLIGYIFALTIIFACFEWTTREYETLRNDNEEYTGPVMEAEIVPITLPQLNMPTNPEVIETPDVPEILDIVDNNEEIEETKIESTEDTKAAIKGPAGPQSNGPVMTGPVNRGEASDEDEIFQFVEENPEFPGGMNALIAYLGKNIKYPSSAVEQNIQGTVVIQFVVNRDGTIVDCKVAKPLDNACDKEAVRVVKGMPKWKPGRQHGRTVRVRYQVPVRFRLQ